MILRNPHTEAVSVKFRGSEYTIEAGENLSVSRELGSYWRERVHQFLEVIEDTEEAVVAEEAPIEVPTASIDTTDEAELAEALEGSDATPAEVVEVEEAPAKKETKTRKKLFSRTTKNK